VAKTEVRGSDELRALAARLLAHLARDDGPRLQPGSWVLGDWVFRPMAFGREPAARGIG
jgi:hypothetical protein